MEKKDKAPETRVLEVVSAEVFFGRHTEPNALKDYLGEYAFTNITILDSKIIAKAPHSMFCSYVPSKLIGGSFEMFCLDGSGRRVRVARGETWFAGASALEEEGDFKESFLLMVRGDTRNDRDTLPQFNVHATPLSQEAKVFLEEAKEVVDYSDKVSMIKSLLRDRKMSRVKIAQLIEEVLAERQGSDLRDGHIHDFATEIGISTATLSDIRATLRLHPDLQRLLDPRLPAAQRVSIDCATFLAKAEHSDQLRFWDEVKNEKSTVRRAARLRMLIP
ncbi:MAG: hypothetical protein V4697_01965 [Patescibacteria group bacterium]